MAAYPARRRALREPLVSGPAGFEVGRDGRVVPVGEVGYEIEQGEAGDAPVGLFAPVMASKT